MTSIEREKETVFMSESRLYGLGAQLDIDQILLEAQHRWLRPAEICEILRNHTRFRIAPEPPLKPPGGSLFLFDRKVLRYFRKDGHSWRKKKDGKTVKEAHERLKAGSVDVLHCYYAHGEENGNFQRRSYWLLEEEHSNIVLVHYREVTGNRANFHRDQEVGEAAPNSQYSEVVPNSEVETSVSSKFKPYSYQVSPQATDTASLMSPQASEYEDAESAYNHQSSLGFHSFVESQSCVMGKTDSGLSGSYYPVPFPDDYQGQMPAIPGMNFLYPARENKQVPNASSPYKPQKHIDFQPCADDLGCNDTRFQSVPFHQTYISNQQDSMNFISGQGNELLGKDLADGFAWKMEAGIYLDQTNRWQISETDSLLSSMYCIEQKLYQDPAYPMSAEGLGEAGSVDYVNYAGSFDGNQAKEDKKYIQGDYQVQLTYTEEGSVPELKLERNLISDGKSDSSPLKQPLIGGLMKEGLKKLDSFDRWVNNELEDVNESHIQHTSVSYWDTVEAADGVSDSSICPQDHLDSYMLSPSLSQDQLFSIIDFKPNWALAGSEIKVLITGKFLKTSQDVRKLKWSCMFGEVEVPAEVISDGVLSCHTPLHKPGRVPFYVTCSNRLACSEVREFDYCVDNVQDVEIPDIYCGGTDEVILRMRFAELLCPESSPPIIYTPDDLVKNSHLASKISSLLQDDNSEWEELLKLTSEEEFYPERVKDHLLQKLLKEKLHVWLLQKLAEGGKGASVLDDEGQGVLHFAAALGYNWALPPTLVAGVSVNFRDVNGWTALHWAAFCGREQTVGFLISSGAAPGALTDPSPLYPSGRTPADLAYAKGHKGIAGFLAESSLSDHLSALQVKDAKASERNGGESTAMNVVQRVTERAATPGRDGDLPYGLSLKDSLAAVCNATQAAARIHQVFRVQSFQRKQLKEHGDSEFGMSDERALSLVAVKSRLGRHEEPGQTAAIRIQNKFRSWKGRKEYLTIRQHIVKIQAHVRGHQVRKNYRKFIWSVGIIDKVILRWKRKGSGLRAVQQESIAQGSSQQLDTSSKDDDYDFLKEGRKQTEERLQKALARVKSMVQYPEARDQYRRLLNVVTDMKENKQDVYDKVLINTEEGTDFDDLIDIDALLGDDTHMPSAS